MKGWGVAVAVAEIGAAGMMNRRWVAKEKGEYCRGDAARRPSCFLFSEVGSIPRLRVQVQDECESRGRYCGHNPDSKARQTFKLAIVRH